MCLASQLCPTLCDLMGYSLPGSSVHGMLQSRILKCVAMLSFRGSEHSLSLCRETVYHLNYQGSPEGALVLVEPGVASPWL